MTNVVSVDYAEEFKKRNRFSYPALNQALQQLRLAYQMAPYCKRISLVVGESGTGKSALKDIFVNELNKGQDFDIAVKVKLNAPNGIAALLKQIAEPIVSLKSTASPQVMKEELNRAIKAQGIKFIAIDEINSAINATKTKSKVLEIADTLKYLSDADNGACIALFGTNDTETLYLEAQFKQLSHGQLETRTNSPIRLNNFAPNNDWIALSKYLLRNIKAPHELKLSEEFLTRTYIATRGNFRKISDLFMCANTLVQTEQFDVIDFETLAHAY